ncbi:AcrR family transcriptional regulator [Rhodococcus sp. PvR044]|uniref:TetR/AcrR family transcriptional regulator n=1 Tax=Rhodococcus sp. PvR044 TaxID=3156402 RepID=UPI003393005A
MTSAFELLWRDEEPARRGRRPSLSVREVVAAAVGIADANGLEAVSLQRVAAEFGFTTTSLYRYVPDKATLLTLMLDEAIGAPPDLSGVEGGWRPRLEAWARELHRLFVRRPWLLASTGDQGVMGPNQLGWMDSALRAFADTGLEHRDVHQLFLLLLGHVRGVAGQAAMPDAVSEQWRAEWLGSVSAIVDRRRGDYPALIESIDGGGFEPGDRVGLELGLRCVLDGIEAFVGRAR